MAMLRDFAAEQMSCLALEHLASVPLEVFALWFPFRSLCLPDGHAVIGQQALLKPRRAVRLVRDEQHAVINQVSFSAPARVMAAVAIQCGIGARVAQTFCTSRQGLRSSSFLSPFFLLLRHFSRFLYIPPDQVGIWLGKDDKPRPTSNFRKRRQRACLRETWVTHVSPPNRAAPRSTLNASF